VSEGDMTGGSARKEQTCAVCGGNGKVVFEISFCFYGKWVLTLKGHPKFATSQGEGASAGARRPSSRALRPSSSPLPLASPVAGSSGRWSPALANQVGGAVNQRGQIGRGHAGKPLRRSRAVVWLPPVTGVAPADRRCLVVHGIGDNGQIRASGNSSTAGI